MSSLETDEEVISLASPEEPLFEAMKMHFQRGTNNNLTCYMSILFTIHNDTIIAFANNFSFHLA